MATSTFSGRAAARNPLSLSSALSAGHTGPAAPCPVHPGLVQHELLTPSVQVQILSIIDDTGSAAIGDIAGELPQHIDPVGAIFAMIAANVLVVLTSGLIDANSLVARSDKASVADAWVPCEPSVEAGETGSADDAASDDVDTASTALAMLKASLPGDLLPVPTCSLRPLIIVGSGEYRTEFGRVDELQRPGVYILLCGTAAYVGYGAAAGFRIIDGRQLPDGDPDCIIAIVDENDGLSCEDAKALERILWVSVAGDQDFNLVNGVPCGAAIAPERYDELRLFVAQIVVSLRHAGLMFLSGSARDHMAGPIAEPDRVGDLFAGDNMVDAQALELSGFGYAAHVVGANDGQWLLLAGSKVRRDLPSSASGSVVFQRSALLHSGVLEVGADGSDLIVMRDLVFPSSGTLSSFVTGSKKPRLMLPRSPDAPNLAA